MSRLCRALGAGLVLAAAAVFGAVTPVASQSADPCAASNQGSDRIEGQLETPVTGFVGTDAAVSVKASGFRYRDPGTFEVGEPQGDVTELHAQLILCGDNGRVLPEPSSARVTAGGEPKSLDWTTPELAYNGAYAVRFTAVASTGAQRVIVRPFLMDVPARQPADVKTASAASGTEVTLTWKSNPEPDIAAYGIEWTSEPGDGFADAQVKTVEPASGDRQTFTHDPGAGTWRYRVTAARYGTSRDDLNVSEPSTQASATVAAPPTTTAPASGSGSGNGAPGGGGTAVASSGASSPTTAPSAAGATSVDLKRFSQLLDQRRTAAPSRPRAEPDPGFEQTLPFTPGDEPVVADAADEAAADRELGSTQEIITDDSERVRAMSFVAAGLLAFVVALGMRMVKSAADRMPDLEATASEAVDAPASPDADVNAPHPLDDVDDVTATNPELRDLDFATLEPAMATPAAMPAPRRRRATTAPTLDVPLPARRERRPRRTAPPAATRHHANGANGEADARALRREARQQRRSAVS